MSKVRCPICDAAMAGSALEYPDYPFCSRRCKVIDLGRWLGEGYRVAGKEVDPDDDENRSTPEDSAP